LFKLDFPQYEVKYIENNLFLNDWYPFAHASLDGWLEEEETGRKGILEIKTTNILQSMQKEKWNHRIPDNYFIQCLHYLAVTNFDFVILKAQLKFDYDGEIFLNTKHYYIYRTEVAEDIKYLMEEEQKFYEHILSGEQPPLVLPEI
jgi:predicted phage-related endonuclease